jgi:tetraacyldisaccharide 4'-kinase
LSAVRARLAHWIDRLWYAPQPPPVVLRMLEGVYRRISRARGNRPAGRPGCPVIVVGNLVVGGSGKTPVVAELVGALAEAGRKVAIVTRGYGSSAGAGPLRVEQSAGARCVGDEALELARVTGVEVWVGSRRDRALEAAVASGADTVVSDDGLQHAALPRSFEICVIDARRGFGNGHLLPAGPLRQSPDRLAQVDLVLIKRSATPKAAGVLPEGTDFELEPGELCPVDPRSRARPPAPGSEVDALAGIADPEAFFDSLSRLGYRVRRHRLADHQPIDPHWLERLPGPVVMTAKDRARLGPEARSDAFVLPVRARLPSEVVRRIVEHVRKFQP